jgi:CrcB protein
MNVLFVALGGALGASCRYGFGLLAGRFLGLGFPWGTLGVNVVGSFLMGLVLIAFGRQFIATEHQEAARLFLMTGVLGGFTTFSAFSLDAFSLWERGETTLAVVYVLASVMLSLLAIIAGVAVGRSIL